ncbi:hypothetical protein FACS189430_04160 [Bacteroidia bacterium]|nr:hypothetical protein FACS189430_04160 [Bacteroidia bacterium]
MTAMNSESEHKETLIQFVQEYATKRNEIEDYVREQSKKQDESRPVFTNNEEKWAWLKANPQTNWFEKFSELLAPIFDTHCTDKNRVYGGKNTHSFGFPVKFNGIDKPIETDVIFKNKNRAEVYFKTETKFTDEYLFIVLRKNNEWRIDSYKGRRYGNEKWDNKIL